MSLPLPTSACLATDPKLGACLHLKSAHGTALVALHGATVVSYVPTGAKDLLWLSPDAGAAPGKAIRGGIPLRSMVRPARPCIHRPDARLVAHPRVDFTAR